MTNSFIRVRGARVHNLKNIDVDIPREKLVVITGLSGSGKSSLAFDTLYAEGQRRYVESLSAYARQFLGLMDKPDVDQIEGLSPAISIDQKTASHNPRSTVGTVTEVYDYLRLMYARIGIPHCPQCGNVVAQQTVDQIVRQILDMPNDTRALLLAPTVRDKKGEHKKIFEEVQRAGYARVRVDGNVVAIEEALDMELDKQHKHTIDVIVDRLQLDAETKKDKQRLHDSVETTLDLGDGVMILLNHDTGTETVLSDSLSCPNCHISLPPIEPRNFSFNSPHGACPACTGLGTTLEVDADLVIPNKRLSIAQGAIRPWSRTASGQTWMMRIVEQVAQEHGFSPNTPVKDLTKEQLDIVLYGTGNKDYDVNKPYHEAGRVKSYLARYEGVVPNLERRYKETDSDYIRGEIEGYMRSQKCAVCLGKRLKPEALAVTVADKSIDVIVGLSIDKAAIFFDGLAGSGKEKKNKLGVRDAKIAKQVLKEIRARLSFLENVGLDYLTVDRSASTLSGGEAQRIRLATQIGSSLTGVIYILDEPSIGLHQRDNTKLITMLKNLRDLGNTVLVVEHDEETIRSADHVIDVGPGAGKHGGTIVAEGKPNAIASSRKSLTGQYLSGHKKIEIPKVSRKGNGKSITIVDAKEFNLKNITVNIPLGKFVCITGVSGSGKSTLMTEILAKAVNQYFYQSKDLPGAHKEVTGLEHLDKVIHIDQSPIGRTPRSNPATYTGVFTHIRDIFTQVPESKIRGYKPGRFSFNVKGGRCEVCQGDGVTRIEMHFLPDVYVECEECHGQRYSQQVLEIHYKGKNISEVLNMTVEDAHAFFKNIPVIRQKMQTLTDVGLGYIHFGQNATTLSGGEAQRIKLATELSRRSTGRTLYILDEPTTGLHFEDVRRLLGVLGRLADKGNTVLVIEHNLDVIKSADWVIDLGPEGGDRGGELIAEGSPRDVSKVAKSYTGQYLKPFFR